MGEVGQTVDDSYFCLDWVVPKGMSQVWRRLEVGNHKRRTLNTRLSSGTSEHTSSSSRNAPGRMLRSDLFCYWYKLKMKLTYREKNLQDYLFGGFRSTLKSKKCENERCGSGFGLVAGYTTLSVRVRANINSVPYK